MKHKPIPKALRLQVFEKYNHHCAYCGCELEYKNMQIDHLESLYGNYIKKKEIQNDNINNLMPSCRQCNFYKGGNSLETMRQFLLSLNKKFIDDYNLRINLAKKYGIIEVKKWNGVFYFEKKGTEK